eukprot:m.57205 g.57205  ORF g.57205 m.57205 type:complete len:70 (-) comp12712_c0_seq1:617-826(-)
MGGVERWETCPGSSQDFFAACLLFVVRPDFAPEGNAADSGAVDPLAEVAPPLEASISCAVLSALRTSSE